MANPHQPPMEITCLWRFVRVPLIFAYAEVPKVTPGGVQPMRIGLLARTEPSGTIPLRKGGIRHGELLMWFIQWEFQDPKMEVLYHIRQYFGGIFPLIYWCLLKYSLGKNDVLCLGRRMSKMWVWDLWLSLRPIDVRSVSHKNEETKSNGGGIEPASQVTSPPN